MKYWYLAFLLILICSCSAKKGVRYFENIDKSQSINGDNFPPVVYKPGDLLRIIVSSPTNMGVAPFNLTESSYIVSEGVPTTTETHRAYLVGQNGKINMPVLGEIVVQGKTNENLRMELEDSISSYVKDPRVEIVLINFQISVLGDVSRPGTFEVPNGRISIFEAIALAGDLTITGKRTHVYVLRENNESKDFINLNLLDDSLFNSPAYYLQQNDVVYVEQGKFKTREAGWESRIPIITSVLAIAVTLVTILTR